MNLHRNIAFASTVWRDWPGLRDDDVNLALAPLFPHHRPDRRARRQPRRRGVPLVLGYRFDPAATLGARRAAPPHLHRRGDHRLPGADARARLRRRRLRLAARRVHGRRARGAGGRRGVRSATGVRLHNAYGLTESTSPLTLTPLGAEGRVDPASRRAVRRRSGVRLPRGDPGDDGAASPPGEIGEIVATGPQVVPGYWRKPDETAIALPTAALRTGDVGYVDGDGWVYLVDRRKDLIIASGTRCGRARWKTSSTPIRRCGKRRSSAWPTPTAARR
jgi:long-chain acyl-CoA synthetase